MNVIFFASGEGFCSIVRDMAIADELGKRGHMPVICAYGEATEKAKTESQFNVVEMPPWMSITEKEGKLDISTSIARSIMAIPNAPMSLVTALWTIKKYKADAIVVDDYNVGLFAAILSGVPTYSIFNCIHPYGIPAEQEGMLGTLMKLIKRVEMTLYNRFTKILICDFAPPNTIAKYNVEGFAKDVAYTGPICGETPEKLPSVSKIRKKLRFGKFILESFDYPYVREADRLSRGFW